MKLLVELFIAISSKFNEIFKILLFDTLHLLNRTPNQYHESFKTNSDVKFSKEWIAIWIFQIKRAPFGENRNCLFKMLITF